MSNNDNPHKSGNGMLVAGLIAYAIGLVALAVMVLIDLVPNNYIPWLVYVLGLIPIVLGFYLLWKQNKTYWPELMAISLLVFAVFLFFYANLVKEEDLLDLVRLPVSADKFPGGIEGLARERAISIVVHVPNASSTPEVQVTTVGKIVDIGEKAIVLEVDTHEVAALQAAANLEKAAIGVSYLDALPTKTTEPISTEEPTATPTRYEDAPDGFVHLEIAAKDIHSRASSLDTCNGSRLVVVEKSDRGEGTPASTSIPEIFNECVKITNFLDGDGLRQDYYQAHKIDKSGKTTAMLIKVPIGQVTDLGRALARNERIYLMTDLSCPGSSTTSCTPTPESK